MICSNCGKALEDECLFCTECGYKVNLTQSQTRSNKTANNNKAMREIENFVDRYGDTEINKCISIAAIVSMISIRFLNFIFFAVLITIINSYLIYYSYKKNSKADMKIILWSVSVLVVGVLIFV